MNTPRICVSCQGTVRVTKIIEHLTNHIPSGTSFVHKCSSCGVEFTTESTGRKWLLLVVAALPLALLVGLSFRLTSMPLVLVAVIGLPSLLIIGRTAKRWVDEHRNPPRTRQQASSTV